MRMHTLVFVKDVMTVFTDTFIHSPTDHDYGSLALCHFVLFCLGVGDGFYYYFFTSPFLLGCFLQLVTAIDFSSSPLVSCYCIVFYLEALTPASVYQHASLLQPSLFVVLVPFFLFNQTGNHQHLVQRSVMLYLLEEVSSPVF